MTGRGWIVAATVAVLALVTGQTLTDAVAGPPNTREDRELARQERQIRQGKGIVRRLLRNPRLSPEVKQQAAELQAALERRERGMEKLNNLHQQFLAQHQSDLAELESLRKRAFEIDQRLSAERADVLRANESELEEVRRNSERAIELIERLRGTRAGERREQRERN